MSVRVLYTQRGFPLFQNKVYSTLDQARACPTGDIELVEDLVSGLIRNDAFIPEAVTYDTTYNNEQANSGRFRNHLEHIAKLVEAQLGRSSLIEVGCGKGYFLEMLQDRGVEITGFDPTYDGKNTAIHRKYFDPQAGLSGSGIVLRHVLEHIPNPVEFLNQLCKANGSKGLIYIEVPCLEWIMSNKTWFDVFFEHVNYFRLSDFEKMFSDLKFAAHTFDGQYLSIVADISSIRMPNYSSDHRIEFPADFMASLEHASKINGPLIVWGGGSKGVIFSLMVQRAGLKIDRVIDINPAKQGRYLPVTGLRVYSPEDGLSGMPEGTSILVMNPIYLEEVQKMAGPRFNCKGA